ncbi:MAG: hypothetical protein AVO34_09595 [Firmicutes bacterium ML8_F2]|jgi:hypothetical protein|nr:MAG: hypothetical protein AVO34_09595 [Firmicutes bacterium ML8_F2]
MQPVNGISSHSLLVIKSVHYKGQVQGKLQKSKSETLKYSPNCQLRGFGSPSQDNQGDDNRCRPTIILMPKPLSVERSRIITDTKMETRADRATTVKNMPAIGNLRSIANRGRSENGEKWLKQ